jgi:hypothetical protein
LNEPVGLRPSYLKYIFPGKPIFSGRFTAGIRGVFPSNNVITGVLSVTGKYCRKCSISPRYDIDTPLYSLSNEKAMYILTL